MQDEEAVREFLGDRPSSAQLREWIASLEHRLAALRTESKRGPGSAASWEGKITQLERQIAALREEEAVTQFVEDSVRVTLAMGTVADGLEDIEE